MAEEGSDKPKLLGRGGLYSTHGLDILPCICHSISKEVEPLA